MPVEKTRLCGKGRRAVGSNRRGKGGKPTCRLQTLTTNEGWRRRTSWPPFAAFRHLEGLPVGGLFCVVRYIKKLIPASGCCARLSGVHIGKVRKGHLPFEHEEKKICGE